MRIVLEVHGEPCRSSLGPYNEADHDVRAVLMDICEALNGPVPTARFEVGGFGETNWPVSVSVDLPVLLEQLPAAIYGVSRRQLVKVDFYEQGIERQLVFQPTDSGFYSVTCSSGSDWEPKPSSEVISQQDIIEMLERVKENFLSAAAAVWPASVGHPWLLKWAEPPYVP